MGRKRLLELLARKKAGSITLAEQVELAEMLGNPDYASFSHLIDQVFETPIYPEISPDKHFLDKRADSLLKKIATENQHRIAPVKRIWYRWVAAAAILILAGGLGLWAVIRPANKLVSRNAIETKKGSKSNIELPDGTRVWINADTRLTYDRNFGDGTREVQLTGEAYFDVVKDTKRPFIVHAGGMDVTVLGTAFNVRAYANDPKVEATLLRGSIEVTLKDNKDKKITLKPNEKITVRNTKTDTKKAAEKTQDVAEPDFSVMTIRKDLADHDILWTRNKLVFDHKRLEEIVTELERWYSTDIEIINPDLRNKVFSGVFENKSLDEVIGALKLAGRFEYEKRGDRVLLK